MIGMEQSKTAVRQLLRDRLDSISVADRHTRSAAICSHVVHSPEFAAAQSVMMYLPTAEEVDPSPIALRAWQAGKTVVVPKVAWHQRRMLPVELTSLNAATTTTGPGVREPLGGKPYPIDFIDLVIVPGLGFAQTGYRIGRGMGFYDRFLADPQFCGDSCGLAFDEQMLDSLPVLDHDVQLNMLATIRGIARFGATCPGRH